MDTIDAQTLRIVSKIELLYRRRTMAYAQALDFIIDLLPESDAQGLREYRQQYLDSLEKS